MFSFFFLYFSVAPPDLHSFPTRRSSDLSRLCHHRFHQSGSFLRLFESRRKKSDSHRDCDNRIRWESDRKSTRLNSSHVAISYAVFCLKKKNISKCLDERRDTQVSQRLDL